MHALSLLIKPLVNSCVDNVPVRIAPDLNQPLLQFISALAVCMLNTFLNGRPYLIVNWAVWRSKIQRNSLASICTAV